jgi:uncharacterized membrane protein
MVTSTETSLSRHPIRVVRVIRSRPRLFSALLVGVIVTAILFAATDWRVATKLLLGWDIAIGLYLILVHGLMARSDVHRIKRRAAMQDEGQLTMLAMTIAAAAASLIAIFFELGTVGGAARSPAQLILATLTIVLSWAFIHAMFALHYAHEYYGDGRDRQVGGMTFPGDDKPDYWDFAYFSFVIGMCAQVSDVAITSKTIRRIVLLHGIVSFLFNAALLALTVNIAASAI